MYVNRVRLNAPGKPVVYKSWTEVRAMMEDTYSDDQVDAFMGTLGTKGTASLELEDVTLTFTVDNE